MKKCNKCKEVKEEEKFSKNKGNKDGYSYICKDCKKREDKEYRKTFKGLIFSIYSKQKCSSKRRGHPLPKYTSKELLNWTYSNKDFLKLFNEWHKKDCPRGHNSVIPSIDRIDNSKGYNFNNIRWVTSLENNRLGNEYKKKIGSPKTRGKNNPKSNTKEHYSKFPVTRANFKNICKNQKWNKKDFEEIYSGIKTKSYHKKYYYIKKEG